MSLLSYPDTLGLNLIFDSISNLSKNSSFMGGFSDTPQGEFAV
jgi:hypothetical protein